MKLIGRLLGISLLILFFLAGLFFPRLLKILKKEPIFPDPGMPPSAAVKVEPEKVLKPEELTLKIYRNLVSNESLIDVEDKQLMPEELVTYRNKDYSFAIDVIAGFHVEEHAWMDNQAPANPQLVWQASFFYDGYGNDLSGKSAKPAIEISIEETLFRNLQEAFLESSVPCGMQLRGMCQKIMPCSCGLSTQEYDFQGIKGRVAEIECFKGMRGVVFLKGKRLYKFLFLSDLAGHRVFTLKQIEAMLKTIRFKE